MNLSNISCYKHYRNSKSILVIVMFLEIRKLGTWTIFVTTPTPIHNILHILKFVTPVLTPLRMHVSCISEPLNTLLPPLHICSVAINNTFQECCVAHFMYIWKFPTPSPPSYVYVDLAQSRS